uniref:Transposon protein, putative, CACTA, En/Spm sub-class n=1 Tax=Oryza sativa subsp. japonica TaxID=39947 RepID=Q33AJ6_ORYSJ|nr:transposon protein, putative, CACTA, En/Spm sub-class [Oryza sativa Japonica Group]
MDAKGGVSDKAFGDLLKLVKNILPEGNKLPETTYEAKKIVCPLGLEVQKIHACPNDCILYRGEEYENLEACPVCKALRYKIRREDPCVVDGQPTKKRIPAKMMWYFPIIPWLRRLFRNKGNTRMMRWHAEERQQDRMLRHPADGSLWQNIDRKFKDFGKDARNIRFGLSTDGMNPFGEMSSGHSTWPVTMCIYILPPWLCMKRKYIMMPIIIQGPKQPGNDIDVYLRPLVDDLKLLWKKEALYMGHRRFLAANHSVRKKGKHFEHKADHRMKPKHRSGKKMFAMVNDLKVVFGMGPGSQPIKSEDGHAAMWKKNSIFWELPYWEFLDVRHAIDVMHLTKNLCVNLIGFLGVYGKSKIHWKHEKGSHYLSPASYTLSKAEKESMFECLESIKVPSGYSTNIKRIISTKEKKFTNLMSHNCHVLMTQLLPVVIRGILPDNVRATITKLGAFMNAISQKVIDPDRLEALQNDVVQCLVSFELIFPPSFFNIMTHLLCHLVKEIGILEPVYLHNMFPFERYMGVLKKYVRYRARPEASIAKGYGTEEVIDFCVEFIEDLRPIGVPESRHEGRLRGKGTLGWKAIMTVDNNLFRKAHFTVLQQSSLVAPYIEEHLAPIRARNIAQDMKSTNQNRDVRINAMGHDGTTGTYYGAIEDIWELDYGLLKVPLFRCQRVRFTGGGVTIDDSAMTTVDLNKVGYSDEPFVLANDVTQVFYVKDMSSKGKKSKGPDESKRHVVLPGKRKIVGVEDKTDEDYDQLDGQPPFTVTIDPSILLSNEDTPYSRSDHKEGTTVRRKKDVVVVVPQAGVMADRDEEQILYDTIAKGNSQYWNEEEGNEDPNQYLNEEGNVERDAERNEEGNVERDAEGNEEEEASGNIHPSRGYREHSEKVDSKENGRQFQNFKGDLYQKYILKGQTPNFNTFPKLRDHWDEFVAYKTSQQGEAMMERNKENAAKKKYHHHLGSGGYSVTMPKWEEMEASLLERVDGSLVFSDQIREGASRLTDAVEASSQGTFRPDREKDELSLALQTPEHPGRTRGKGVIPWKIGFKEDIHTYRSQMRSKRDIEAKIADLEYRVSSYELSMQEEVARKVDERMAAHRSQDPQPYIPPAMVSPSGNRSSCASTGQVASGMTIPTEPSGTSTAGRFQQDTPRSKLSLWKPRMRTSSWTTLEETHHLHLRLLHRLLLRLLHRLLLKLLVWYLPKSRAPQAPPPAPTRATKKAKVDATKNKDPGYDCTQEELDAYVASEVRRQLKPRSPEKKIPIDLSVRNFFKSMSAPAKEAIKLSDYGRTLKKAYSAKSKPVPQLGEQPNQEVEPLVTGEEIGIKEFISDTGLTTDQLLRGAPIPKAEVKYKYELGKPLVKPEQLQSL